MQRPQRSSDKHAQDRTILGHPSGLFVLFFTEMWERFSYYGMRSLLVLYMVDYLFQRPEIGERVLGLGLLKAGFEAIFGPLEPQPLSSQIYGFYTALVYLTPFFGGILADKVIGQRRAVILASRGMGPEERRSVAWLLGTTFILTLGELYLSPIGLSFVTKMAPGRIISMMMGVWFLSSFFGNYLSGFLGTYWERMSHEAYFAVLTGLGFGAGIAIWLLGRALERHRRTPST